MNNQIYGARLLTLRTGLSLELQGLRMSRGRTCYSIIKNEFNLKGNKQKVYDQFTDIVTAYGLLDS